MNVTVITIVSGALSTGTKDFIQGVEDLEIRKREKSIQTTVIVELGQNTEKSAGDLRRLAVDVV